MLYSQRGYKSAKPTFLECHAFVKNKWDQVKFRLTSQRGDTHDELKLQQLL